MKLFFIRADDADGSNQDLLVEAPNKILARALWHTYFNHEDDYETEADWPQPLYMGEVPLTGKMGAIRWDVIIPADYEPE